MATRRSKRVNYSVPEGLPGPRDEDYHSTADEISEEEAPKRRTTKSTGKRKAAEPTTQSSGGQAPPPKRQRGNKGLLKDLVDLPIDVVLEIFGKLSPGDLLSLAQTSKELRGMLMSRSSVSTWREARQNEPGLPDCPTDLSEPQYANLCFGKHCMHCMRSRITVTYTIWSGRTRLCKACVETECQNYYNTPSNSLNHSMFVYEMYSYLPHASIKKPGRSGRVEQFWLKSAIDDLASRLSSEPTDEEQAVMRAEFKARQDHAQACEAWFTERQEAIHDQKTSTVDERRDLIVNHARALGWAEEFDLSGHALEALKRSSIIRKACAKNVTDKVLTNLEDTINEVLTLSKATRLADAKDALFRKRLPVYEAAFKQCRLSLHPTEPYPSPRQLFEVHLVRNLIVHTPEDHELTVADFKPMSDDFRTLVDEWRARVSLNLKSMIATAYDSESMLDQDNILDLATSIFMCARCQAVGSQQPEPISYPRVLSHTCALSVHRNLPAPVPQAEEKALREVLGEVEWNASGALTYNKDMAKFIGDVLELCGFDRRTTTKAEMDAVNPVIECLSCHDERQGRVVMTWWTVLHHWTLRHSDPYIHNFFGLSTGEMKLRLVDDPKDADRIRTELAVHQAKKAVYWSSSICAHDQCHFIGSTVTCKKHWREEHGRPAQAGDILPRLDHRHFSEDCYFWPPWEVEELDLLEFTEIVVLKGS